MKSYRELKIYQEAKRLAVKVHKISFVLPKFELYKEGSQIRRYKADYIKHLIYSQSECDETILHLDFLYETGSFTDKASYEQLKNEYDFLSKRINKFVKWVEETWISL